MNSGGLKQKSFEPGLKNGREWIAVGLDGQKWKLFNGSCNPIDGLVSVAGDPLSRNIHLAVENRFGQAVGHASEGAYGDDPAVRVQNFGDGRSCCQNGLADQMRADQVPAVPNDMVDVLVSIGAEAGLSQNFSECSFYFFHAGVSNFLIKPFPQTQGT